VQDLDGAVPLSEHEREALARAWAVALDRDMVDELREVEPRVVSAGIGLARVQHVETICRTVAWLTRRERLKVAWALLTRRAFTD
jgi:hypothetical protein